MAEPTHPHLQPNLPAAVGEALWRGLRGTCPRCNGAPLFRKWLKPVETCAHCGQDWSAQQADDFPAYIGIFVVGHLLAPIVIAMIGTYGMSPALTLSIILPLAVAMLVGMLQPVKGGVIAFLWWFGIGAFVQERRGDSGQDAGTE